MIEKNYNIETLVVGGEIMIDLLKNINIETLGLIIEDLEAEISRNSKLVKTCRLIYDRRIALYMLEAGDTIVAEEEE